MQQAIDRGFRADEGSMLSRCWRESLVAITIATFAQRNAVARLAGAAKKRCTPYARLFEHIHRLSIADHTEERKGARCPSDERRRNAGPILPRWPRMVTDGTLMLMVAGVMLAYDWVWRWLWSPPLAYVLVRQSHGAGTTKPRHQR